MARFGLAMIVVLAGLACADGKRGNGRDASGSDRTGGDGGGGGGQGGQAGGGGAGGGATDAKPDSSKDAASPAADAAVSEGAPAETAEPMCGDKGGLAAGSCPAGLMCLGCGGAGPTVWRVCSTPCTKDADCKAPERPLCQLAPLGFCVAPPGLPCCPDCV